jgi:hypothetical protein
MPSQPVRLERVKYEGRSKIARYREVSQVSARFRLFSTTSIRRHQKAGRFVALRTFDNFNQAIAGVRGLLAAAARTICDTLLVPSLDEASTHYGLIAEAGVHLVSLARRPSQMQAVSCMHLLRRSCVRFSRF